MPQATPISPLTFGGAALGNLFADVSFETCMRVLSYANTKGITSFDTAPAYGHGLSELRLGQWIKANSLNGKIWLSTKAGILLNRITEDDDRDVCLTNPHFSSVLPYKKIYDYSYNGIMRSVKESLLRLNVSSIDMLYLHDLDPESLGQEDFEKHFAIVMNGGYKALQELKQQGRIKGFGLAVKSWQVCHRVIAANLDFSCFMIQNGHTLLNPCPKEFLDLCAARNAQIVVAGPFASGILAGGDISGTMYNHSEASDEIKSRVASFKKICGEHGAELATAALNWPMRHSAIISLATSMRNVNEVEQNIKSITAPLSEELYQQLDTFISSWQEETPLELVDKPKGRLLFFKDILQRQGKQQKYKIIDGHQHFWQLANKYYDWLTPDLKSLYQDFMPNDLSPIIKRNNVSGTVLVQASDKSEEKNFLLELADNNDFILGVVAWFDMLHQDIEKQLVEFKYKHAKFVGIRPMLQDISDDEWMLQPELAPAYNTLAKLGLSFDALVKPQHLKNLLTLVKHYYNLTFIIDHCAKPEISSKKFDDWAKDITKLAQQRNVYCKLSGLATEAGSNFTFNDLKPYIDHIFNNFTSDRIIWGSDWPVINLASNYDDWFNNIKQYINSKFPNPWQQAQIFSSNAIDCYGLTIKPTATETCETDDKSESLVRAKL